MSKPNPNYWDRYVELEVDGEQWLYLMEEDIEPGEVRKQFHFLAKQDGDEWTQKHIDWSPYHTPSVDDIKMFIECGCPSRMGNGNRNWTSEDLKETMHG